MVLSAPKARAGITAWLCRRADPKRMGGSWTYRQPDDCETRRRAKEMPESAHRYGDPDLRRRYEAAGFLGRVGFGERAALLVIDMAGAWTEPREQLGSNLDGVLRSILALLTVARASQTPVYFTTMAYDSPEAIGTVVSRKLTNLHQMITGSDRVQLVPALKRRPEEPLLVKPRASAFFGTPLLEILKQERVDTVVVTGCSTSGCIRATCESAFDNDLHVIVPLEAVGDRSPTAHEANLFDIDARYADVVPLEEVLRWLSAIKPSAGADAF
ncbi:MAG: isochorismatase family protein [Chloroflexi bacterium]|nr:MAG: isochorismatase family protein [Chloroflexota bacterium]